MSTGAISTNPMAPAICTTEFNVVTNLTDDIAYKKRDQESMDISKYRFDLRNQPLAYDQVDLQQIQSWSDVIPTKEEMTAGFKALSPQSPDDAQWCPSDGGANSGCGLQGFDSNFGSFASFDI